MEHYDYDHEYQYNGGRARPRRDQPPPDYRGGLRGGSLAQTQNPQQWQSNNYRESWQDPAPGAHQEFRHRARSPAPARRGIYPEDRGHHGHGYHHMQEASRYLLPAPPPPPPRRISDDDSFSGQRNPRSNISGQKAWMGKGIPAAMKEELLSAAHSRLRRVG